MYGYIYIYTYVYTILYYTNTISHSVALRPLRARSRLGSSLPRRPGDVDTIMLCVMLCVIVCIIVFM